MCGIVATVGMDPRGVEARGPEALRVLAQRGPDDERVWLDEHVWLGHRRLSITDLTAAGRQPMVALLAMDQLCTGGRSLYDGIHVLAERSTG
jgi:asparagine synthase (glutamine-hydrolysing)